MKALVTGSGGFVGKHLVAELKNRKHTVLEFDVAKGQDILNRDHLKKALKECDTVFHLAAIVENSNPKLWEVNVTGTKNIIEEAAKAKIDRFILLSSTGVYGVTKKEVNESSHTDPENNYEKSKLEAEKIVLSHQEELSVGIVRSAMVFGANDYWRRMFKMIEKNYPLPCNGKNHFQVIDVNDLARALVLVAEKGEDGETYLVSGEDCFTLNEFCEEAKEILGVPGKMKHIPTTLALILGKILGIKVMTLENIRHLSKERKYDLSKIKELGYKQKKKLKESIAETLEDLKGKNEAIFK